jgi:hypothetical protein
MPFARPSQVLGGQGPLVLVTSRMPSGQIARRAGRRRSTVRADVIRQFHERGEDGMVEILTELEADELVRLQVIQDLSRGSQA